MLIDNLQIVEGAGTVNLSFPKGTSFPTSPDAGEVFYRTDESLAYVYSGTAWTVFGSDSGSTVTLNDLLPDQANNIGKILSTTGTDATWIDVPAGPSLNDLLPDQTGNGGKVLSTTGSVATWVSEPVQIYDIGFTSPGEIMPSSTLLFFVVPRRFTLPSSFNNCVATVGTITSDVTFSLRKNGVEFGTLAISSAGAASFSALADTVFEANNILSIESPAGAMPTNLGVTFSVSLG